MPHQRKRLILPIILKRIKLWPGLGLIGVRQSGKSTLLREILSKHIDTTYYTLDSKSIRDKAEKSPDSFSEPEKGKLKIIDEVQKTPDLFDAVKFHIDQNRRPGTYILSGSTQFSQLLGVRESLTGRVGIIELFPFNLSEIHQKDFGRYWGSDVKTKSKITLTEFNKTLKSGGMPGFFYLHDEMEFESTAQLWIETTCFRDLGMVIKSNFDGDLAYSILIEVALHPWPTASEIAKKLNKDTRVITKYLEGFCHILVLKKVMPHPLGIGKPIYYLIDSGLCRFLGGDEEKVLRTHVLIEALSYFENNGIQRPQSYYYESSKKSQIPFIFMWKNKKKFIAVQVSDSETVTRKEMGNFDSFKKKILNDASDGRYLLLSSVMESYRDKNLEIHPLRG